jgi:hypothetical protein
MAYAFAFFPRDAFLPPADSAIELILSIALPSISAILSLLSSSFIPGAYD